MILYSSQHNTGILTINVTSSSFDRRIIYTPTSTPLFASQYNPHLSYEINNLIPPYRTNNTTPLSLSTNSRHIDIYMPLIPILFPILHPPPSKPPPTSLYPSKSIPFYLSLPFPSFPFPSLPFPSLLFFSPLYNISTYTVCTLVIDVLRLMERGFMVIVVRVRSV